MASAVCREVGNILNIWELYGKKALGLILAALFAFGIFWLIRKAWYDYGMVPDGARASFTRNGMWEEKPVIDAVSRRICQGETVKLTELASARDRDGDDLTDQLTFSDAAGRRLTGCLDTSVPGEMPIYIRIKSPDTGMESEKQILILVDGRVKT